MWTKEKIKDFARHIGYHCQFTAGELNTLHTVLRDDEDFFGMAEGMMKKVHHNKHSGYGMAVLTDKRFLFYHKGLPGSITLEEFPINTISSISLNRGKMFSALHVYASNVDEIIITQCENNNAARIVQAWQILLEERNLISTGLADDTTSDPATELEKWHSLKEKGIITEEEYNSKKKQILGL